MGKTRPPLKVIVSFDFYSVGDQIAPTGVYYDWLVDQGYCEPIPQVEPGEVECAVWDVSNAETAVLPKPVKRKRGRPRKVKAEQS